MKKQVKDLQIGDILSSGAEIIERPFDAIGLKSNQRKIGIKYPGGISKIQIWNKYTTVTIR
jgi:hypothetical protein